jgi:hypothetical protein
MLGFLTLTLLGCGGGGGSSAPPALVVVSVAPGSASLFLGQTQQFQATVTGSTNTSVTWNVNEIDGGNATVGTISFGGLYTGPASMPSTGRVTVMAVSQADLQASSSATVTLKDDIQVNISPATANVSTGAAQLFTASISASGNPATGVTWSVNGIAGGNSSVGAIAANGADTAIYTAPVVPPSPATVTVAATSVADPSKSGSALITIACSASNSVSPSAAEVSLGQTQTFTASFCLPSGTTIAWDVNGITGGNGSLGTVSDTGAITALYTAPADLPASTTVTIHATAGEATASSTVTITSSVSVSISPPSATIALGQRSSFAATVTNSPDTAVSWSVNGVPNGNAAVGQICQSGSNPCLPPTGPISGNIDFLAPAAVPTANPVTVTAVSRADASRSGVAMLVISGPTGPLAVTISPFYAFIPPSSSTLSTMQFYAAVTGTTNNSVTWSVQGAVAGQGCAGTACGSVDANGLYTAPALAPSPNAISLIATSQADSTKSASATIAVTSGPTISRILPSSVLGGAVESFPLTVQGMNFVAGGGSSASVILLNGTPRSTTCSTTTTCATSLNPADVQSAGTYTIQVQNPGLPGALSNPVPFVVVPFDVSVDAISLSSAVPVATGKDIVVAEPTTAASATPINVDFVGYFTDGTTCGMQGSPLSVTRPSSGSTTVSICIHGNGLDPTFSYAFTGPNGGDIGVTASAVTGLFPGVIELDLQISSATLPGARTLFITTLNNDRAVASGILEVR